MLTVHIENVVADFDSWKSAFDRYERFRQDSGVRRYRVSRGVDDAHRVLVDLDFEHSEQARTFTEQLRKIWHSPQSQRELTEHASALVLDVVHDQ